jgi:hypothetical protein
MTRLADLIGLLHAQGWVVINPAIGAPFNSALHSSDNGAIGDGYVIEVIQRGYLRQRPNQPPQVLKAVVKVEYDISKTVTQTLP